jgi:hypothetical protein
MTPSHSVFYSHINALGAFSRGVNVPRLFTPQGRGCGADGHQQHSAE